MHTLTHPDKNNLPFVDMEFTSYYFQVLKQQQTVSLVALVRKDSTAATTTYNYTLQATNYTLFHHFCHVQVISHRVP